MGGAYDAQVLRQQQEDQRRKQILAAAHGGHNPITGYSTDFEKSGGLHNLKSMLASGDPAAIDAVSQKWSAIGTALSTAQKALSTHTAAALESWDGPAAEAFAKRSEELQKGLANGASYADHTATAMTQVSGHLQKAQTELDGIHDAGFWDHVGDVLGGESDTGFHSDLKSGIDLQTSLKLDGSQLNTEEYRFQQAVLVMQRLGSQYNQASDWLAKNQPQDLGRGDGGVYPPSPAAGPPVGAPRSPAGGPSGGGRSGSGSTAGGRLAEVGGVAGPSPSQGSGTGVGGTVAPVSGGTLSKMPTPPATSLDGISGGAVGGSGAGAVVGGSGGLPGISGLGTAGGADVGGSALAGMGMAAAGLGASGALGGSVAGEEAAGEQGLASERALAEEQAAGGAEGNGTRGMMGGMGGLGRGNGRKNKRRQRAAYLVEDEDTWGQDVNPNPPVIG